MGDNSASITIDVKGAEKAAAAARNALSPWKEQADKARAAFKEFGREAAASVGGILRDFSQVVTVGNTISMVGAIQEVQSLEKATSRLSVAMKQDFRATSKDVDDLSAKIGATPEKVAAYISSVGKSTYNFAGAKKDLAAFDAFAKETGRSLGEQAGLKGAFAKMGIEDGTKGLEALRGTAEKLGHNGGVAALAGQFEALSGTIAKTNLTVGQSAALLASIGKGLAPEQQKEVQQQVIGGLTGQARTFEASFRSRGLLKPGESIVDAKTGKINEKLLLQTAQKSLSGTSRERAMRIAEAWTGSSIAAASLLDADLDAVGAEAGTDAQVRAAASPGGAQEADEARRARNIGANFNSDTFLGGLSKRARHFASENPILSALGIEGGAAGLKLGGRLLAGRGGVVKGLQALRGAKGGVGAAGAAAAPLAFAGEIALFQAQALSHLKEDPEEYRQSAGLYGAGVEAYHPTRLRQARALVKAAGASGGTGEGFVRAAGSSLLAQSQADPALAGLAQQLVGGSSELKGLPEDMAKAVREALKDTKLEITVVDATEGGISTERSEGQQ